MRRKALAALVAGLISSQAAQADVSVQFNRLFVLGDSLSDAGTYSNTARAGLVAAGVTTAPAIQYRFTTNNPNGSSRVWAEVLASQLGITLTPNMINPTVNGGTDYAEGGSRVSNPAGNGYNPAQGITTTPVSTQIDRLLATSPTLGANDLVVVWAGANDALVQLATVSAGATTPTAAGAAMLTEAQNMAAQIDRLKAAGAKHLIVVLLPDIGAHTPMGKLLTGTGGDTLLSGLTSAYNTALSQTLPAKGVAVLNSDKLLADIIANPTRYGFAANPLASTTCGVNPAATGPGNYYNSALTCLSTNPGAQLFADGVHPSAQAHQIFGIVGYAGLQAIAQAASLAIAPAVAIRLHSQTLEARMTIGALTDGFGKLRPVGDTHVYGGAEAGQFDAKGYQAQPALAAQTAKFAVGADRMVVENALVGGALAYTHGTNKYGNNTGEFANDVWLGTLYSTVALSKTSYVNASATLGRVNYTKFNRNIVLPTTTIVASSTPSGDYQALRIGGGFIYDIGSWKGGPYVSLADEKMKIGAFSEASGPASLSFGDVDYHSTRATLGFQAVGSGAANEWRPYVRFNVDRDLKSSDLIVPMGPDSASLASVAVPRCQRKTWSSTLALARYGSDHAVLSVGLGLSGTSDELIGKTLGISYRVGF